MTVWSDKSVLYGYAKDDQLETCLYEGQSAATSALYSKLERAITGIKFTDFDTGSYRGNLKAYRKALRQQAKADAEAGGYKLVTYRLVRDE